MISRLDHLKLSLDKIGVVAGSEPRSGNGIYVRHIRSTLMRAAGEGFRSMNVPVWRDDDEQKTARMMVLRMRMIRQ